MMFRYRYLDDAAALGIEPERLLHRLEEYQDCSSAGASATSGCSPTSSIRARRFRSYSPPSDTQPRDEGYSGHTTASMCKILRVTRGHDGRSATLAGHLTGSTPLNALRAIGVALAVGVGPR
jgi:hypothetical protein